MAKPQVTLEDHEVFLKKIGYLAVVAVGGPFSGYGVTEQINQFGTRENHADVKVGDSAFTGNEWGTVSAVSANTITVQFAHTTRPSGVSEVGYNPVRTEKYSVGKTAQSGTTQQNVYDNLSSIGVVFTYPLNPSPATVPNV